MLAEMECKRRHHNWFGTKIPWEICRKFGIEKKEKWYIVKLEVVMEYDKCKIYVAPKNEWIMKYTGEDQMSLWYRKVIIFAR